MPILRRALTWLLCLALAGQQAAALAALPCEHEAAGRVAAESPSSHAGHVDSHARHSMHESAADPHATHSMHDGHATAATDPTSDAGCDCGCAMMICAQTTSSMLPAELTFANAIPPADSPLSEARVFALDCEDSTPHRPPIAA
jgi:hypothetical protein